MNLKLMFVLLVSGIFLFSTGSVVKAAKEGESGPTEEQLEESEQKSEERKPHLPEIKEEITEKENFEIHVGIVGFYQGAVADRIEEEHIDDFSQPGIVGDIQVTYKPLVSFFENGRFFVRLHAGAGKGADDELGDKLFANLNTLVDNSDEFKTDFDKAFWLAEAYYAYELLNGKLTVAVGKTEPVVFIDNNAFANNPNSQFVGKPFVNNPILNSEDQLAPIVAASFSPIESVSFTALAVSSSFPNAPDEKMQKSIYDRIFDQPMFAAQLAYSPKVCELQGNYRIYFWDATYDHANSAGDTSSNGRGIGISLDQQITNRLGLFARLGYSDKQAYDVDWFWSAGANFKGLFPSRTEDELGIGLSGLKGTVGPDNDGTELHTEVYYRIVLTENFAVSPDIQYVVDPLGNNRNDGIFAGMVRVEFSF
ncbi:MAG: carbohydrate porin [Syntrophobacteraceae bacterium]